MPGWMRWGLVLLATALGASIISRGAHESLVPTVPEMHAPPVASPVAG